MILWILIVAGLIYVMKDSFAVKSQRTKENTAEEILKKRYANGEIDEETYSSMKKEINS
jgi:uncharacterized membrane protein